MIILIDDDGVQRMLTLQLLPRSVVIVPNSPKEILALLQRDKQSVDYIVVDRHMPAEWIAAAKQLIAHCELPDDKVIEWTAGVDEGWVHELPTGAHLRKTGTLEELQPLIDKARRNVGLLSNLIAGLTCGLAHGGSQ